MSEVRAFRGTVLRTLAYGDTSVIVRFLTAELGVLTVMARGVRSTRRKGATVPQLFSSGSVSIQVKQNRDMHPMRDFTADRVRLGLASSITRLAGAALLGDLILRHSGHESQDEVASLMELALDELESAPESMVGQAVLARAWGIVAVLGYTPHLDSCVVCGHPFQDDTLGRFDLAHGGVGCLQCVGTGPRVGPRARDEMRQMIQDGSALELMPSDHTSSTSHLGPHLKLLAEFATYHVSDGRRIAAFDYFIETLPSDPPTEGSA